MNSSASPNQIMQPHASQSSNTQTPLDSLWMRAATVQFRLRLPKWTWRKHRIQCALRARWTWIATSNNNKNILFVKDNRFGDVNNIFGKLY